MHTFVQPPASNPRAAKVGVAFSAPVATAWSTIAIPNAERLEPTAIPADTATRALAFGNISIHARSGSSVQARLMVHAAGDRYEQEADQVAARVVGGQGAWAPPPVSPTPPALQAACTACAKQSDQDDEQIQRRSEGPASTPVLASIQVQRRLNAVRGGRPLPQTQRDFFAPRFGMDFSRVRIHTDNSADSATRSVGALAYTRGPDIVFRAGQYQPDTPGGRALLAHELTHVVQQGAAGPQASLDTRASQPDAPLRAPMGVLQCWPGTGMTPPGDCGYVKYATLRGAVETAKATVNMVGACTATDSCLFLAYKIAAISAEIAARIALDTTCFRGGDQGHRDQVNSKVNMLNRCYRFFTGSSCAPELVEAMAVVIAAARAAITAVAIGVALALVVALVVVLVAAIIALIEVILALAAAAAAAAGEAALIAAGAAAALALLAVIQGELKPEEA